MEEVAVKRPRSFEGKVKGYLGNCRKPGVRYNSSDRQDLIRQMSARNHPTFKELGAYCGCSGSTLGRIESGKIGHPSLKTISIISAIACIDPAPDFSDVTTDRRAGNILHFAERTARRVDAEIWRLEGERLEDELGEAAAEADEGAFVFDFVDNDGNEISIGVQVTSDGGECRSEYEDPREPIIDRLLNGIHARSLDRTLLLPFVSPSSMDGIRTVLGLPEEKDEDSPGLLGFVAKSKATAEPSLN